MQANARVAVNWQGPDCAISAHPSFALPLPEEPLRIPQGARPNLQFSAPPATLSAYAWTPDFTAAEEIGAGQIEVPLDQPARSMNVDLLLEPVASQELPLDILPPGEYAVEIFASWPEGSTGYAFRVQIEVASGSP
ncbi:MAG: hypothetical protein A2148_09875 [Chloroflexi bacterium RBG_16_68_14]|nr:MAG: hypothetical protein A2148_09875 [Chloroflexi bacterium RBG_16_68_14]